PRGTTALGGTGGGEGYAGIINSIAIKFDLYTHGTHNPTTGLFTNGTSPDSNPALDVPITGITLGSGHPIQVSLSYDGSTLSERLVDTGTMATFTHDYPNVTPAQLIGGAAYAGFGGGTGGETATLKVTNWTGLFGPAQATSLRVTSATISP